MELFHLHNQWATRPADERFTTLQQVLDITKKYAASAREKDVPWKDLRVVADGSDMHLLGSKGIPAVITHHAFGQLAARIGAPASYLRDLPGTLAAQNINYGLKNRVDNDGPNDASLLVHVNDGYVLRALTTTKYARLWNYEIVERLLGFADRNGLVPVQPTFTWDGSENVSEETGLYASDHDMVLGLMSKDRVINDGGSPLYRVVIVGNSEVGDGSFWTMRCLVRDICGNLILWGAEEVMELRFRHVGDVAEKWNEVKVELATYLDAGTEEEDKLIRIAKQTVIAGTREDVLDTLFGNRRVGMSMKAIKASYDSVNEEQDGSANTVWGFVQGITRYSQEVAGEHADKRLELDKAARRVMNQTLDF